MDVRQGPCVTARSRGWDSGQAAGSGSTLFLSFTPNPRSPPPFPPTAQPPKYLPLGRLSQLGWTSPCTWSHGCRSAPQRGRDQENHSAWGHGGAPKLHHWSPSEWGPPPRPVKSPHGSLLHSSLATGHCKQPLSALPTNGQEVLAGIINCPSPCLCPRHLGSSEVVPIHGVGGGV